MEKKCWMCQKFKSLEEFGPDKSRKDGIVSHCRECHRLWNKKRVKKKMLENPNFQKDRAKRFRRTNYLSRWCTDSICSHRKLDYNVDLTHAQLLELARHTTRCYYCDRKLEFIPDRGKVQSESPSVDRLDNSSNININNIVICCKQCNVLKSDRSFSEFIEYCRLISEKFGRNGFPSATTTL